LEAFRQALFQGFVQLKEQVVTIRDSLNHGLKSAFNIVSGIATYEETFIMQMSEVTQRQVDVVKELDQNQFLARFRQVLDWVGDSDVVQRSEEQASFKIGNDDVQVPVFLNNLMNEENKQLLALPQQLR